MRFTATDNLRILEDNLPLVGDITPELVKQCYHKYIAPVYQTKVPKSKKKRIWVYQQQYRHTQRDLLKLKYLLNGRSAKGIKEGFVYAITNPAFEGFTKIGSAIDVVDRLNQYQTYSPLRDYKLVRYAFVPDRIYYEKVLLGMFNARFEWTSTPTNLIDDEIKRLSLKFTPV